MILPAEDNLTIYRGATFLRQWQWKTGEVPAPVDLTGASLAMHVRPYPASQRILVSANNQNGRLDFENASEGRIRLLLSAAETELLDFDNGVYDVMVTLADTTVWPLLRGKVEMLQRVTR